MTKNGSTRDNICNTVFVTVELLLMRNKYACYKQSQLYVLKEDTIQLPFKWHIYAKIIAKETRLKWFYKIFCVN